MMNVDTVLDAAQSELSLGEMIHTETFKLQDAMLAIEIGDPKMDIGLRKGDLRSVQELIQAGNAPIDLSPSDTISLFDRLLAMEATWHKGAMLSQTVFTNLYVLDVERLKPNPVLYLGCVAVKATTALLYGLIMTGQVCDEDDILMHTFGINIDPFDEEYIIQILEELDRVVHFQDKGSLVANSTTSGVSSFPKAFLSRLSFRLHILKGLFLAMYPSRSRMIEAAENFDLAATEIESLTSTVVGEETIVVAKGFAPDVNRKAMGLAPPRLVKVLSFESTISHWTSVLKQMSCACRLLLRCSEWKDLQVELTHFASTENCPFARSLVYRALTCQMQNQKAGSGAPQQNSNKMEQIEKFNNSVLLKANRDPQEMIWTPTEKSLGVQFDWLQAIAPGEFGKIFLEQMCIAVLGWCHTMCLNRSRQRRRLRRLLEDWKNIMDHSYNAEMTEEVKVWFQENNWQWTPETPDGIPLAGPLATWTETEVCRTMLGYLMIGIPLDLYAPYELCSLYWYSDYLLNALYQSAMEFIAMKPDVLSAMAASNKKKDTTKVSRDINRKKSSKEKHSHRKGKKKLEVKEQKSKAENVGDPTSEEYKRIMEEKMRLSLIIQVERLMCQGMIRLCLSLKKLALVIAPPNGFSSEQQRFQQRYGCFVTIIRPEPLSYEQYKESVETSDLPVEKLLLMAFDAFFRAQRAVAHIMENSLELDSNLSEHLRGVDRIAKANSLAIRLLSDSIKGSEIVEGLPFIASWDFRVAKQHSVEYFYPCLILKRASK